MTTNNPQEVKPTDVAFYRVEGVVKSKTFSEETGEYRLGVRALDSETCIVMSAPMEAAAPYYIDQSVLVSVTLEPLN